MKTKQHKIGILVVLLIATILSPLDFYIVNLALSPMQKSLNASASQLQMIISFYTCAYAVFQITGGRLGDLMGRKQMFMFGLLGFIVASAVCGLAPSANLIIAGRVLQGVSGAIMTPQVLAIIHVTFSEKEKTIVMGLYSFMFGLAAVLGQMLGGILIAMDIFGLGWKIIFLINIPIGILALFGAIKLIPKQEIKQVGEIDVWGIILFSSFLGLVVYPLTLIGESGWSFSVGMYFVASFIAFLLFLIHEKRLVKNNTSPLIDMRIFKNKNLNIGATVAFLFYCSGIFYLGLGIYLQEDLAWSSLNAGTAIMPFGVGFLLSSLMSPTVTRYLKDKILNLGIFFYALGFLAIIFSLSLSNPIGSFFYVGLFIAGCGMGLTLSSIVRISLRGVDHQYAGLASGVINSALQIGSSIGVASIGGVFFSLGKAVNYAYAFQISLLIVVGLLGVAFFLAFAITRNNKKGF